MFKLFFSIFQRLWVVGTALVLTILEQVATAVALPETLRGLQHLAGWFIGWTESYFTVSPTYMVWVEMASIDEKLVFMAFYFANLLLLFVLWRLMKRMWRMFFNK